MFGDGETKGSPVSDQNWSRRQPSHGTTVELAAEALLGVEEPGQLAGGHAVAVGQRVQAHEGAEALPHQVALDLQRRRAGWAGPARRRARAAFAAAFIASAIV